MYKYLASVFFGGLFYLNSKNQMTSIQKIDYKEEIEIKPQYHLQSIQIITRHGKRTRNIKLKYSNM